jgi:hypothetical protein
MAQLEARVLWGRESLVGRTKTLSPPSKRLSYDINIILNNRLPKSQAKYACFLIFPGLLQYLS